jgi:penicillin amidase
MRWIRRIALALAAVGGVVLLACVAGGLWLYLTLRASLPLVDGSRDVGGLAGPVRIERDALGVPTIRGGSRLDVARATGYVHAQDRFFQMDLLRRRASGELAALFGPAVVASDRAVRPHRFAALARRVIEGSSPDSRAFIEAYAAGVNAGLSALRALPFEYLLLRERPRPWRAEDSILVILAMFIDLHDEDGSHERALGVMRDALPRPLFEFLSPRGTEWDAPVVGEPFATPPVPGPEVVDLRTPSARDQVKDAGPARIAGRPEAGTMRDAGGEDLGRPRAGSNSWAVAGNLTADGGALLANDMHLGIRVPNTWYRAVLVWPEGDGERRVAGVTLPGVPALVAGSNGDVAWGFTNSYGDWNDIVEIDVDPADPDSYRAPGGTRAFERVRETIQVKGGAAESVDIVSTVWGPVVGKDGRGRPRALRWTAHETEAVNVEMRRLETARTLEEALQAAASSGIPPQNFVGADRHGRIAWTIIGRIPRRVGFDGRLPGSWSDGSRRWDGWLPPEEQPRVVDPPGGRLWTANNRVVEGSMLAVLGDGGFDLGARARQIRDDLMAIERATPRDMLGVQLDDRAVFLSRWRDRLLDLLTPEATAQAPRRAEARRFVQDWQGRAAVDSVGFRIVRAFRLAVLSQVFETLTGPCRAIDPGFEVSELSQEEGPLWRLLSETPPHLLDPRYATWDDLLLAMIDRALETVTKDGAPLSEQTWGRRNTARIQHPFSLAVPGLARLLDMPPDQLPGEDVMPRVQGPTFGASERFVVSPGREEQGLFHMPTGQCAHPLSSCYRAGHAAWAHGEPTPFLPGPAAHFLILEPAG